MSQLSLTTIILTYNEEMHIRRCLENVCPISQKVIVVDSPSTDRTQEICREFENVEVIEHKYPGNQAAQFNWAIDNLAIDTDWVLRIDADEYLLPELVEEISAKLPTLPEDVTGIELKRRHIFMGKWVKHGIYPVIMMRMFRTGCGRYDNRLMDEHIMLDHGRSIVLDNDFCDHSLISLEDYRKKHLNYAKREAAEVLDELYNLSGAESCETGLGNQALEKHRKKSTYNKLPLFLRAFAYFCYRYILKGGFLDGKAGFMFAYTQGLWYRTMVDVRVFEAMKYLRASGVKGFKRNQTPEGKAALKEFIKVNWNITL